MTYEQWEQCVPAAIKSDSLWKTKAYRLGLFLSDLAWRDAARLLKERRTICVADQLYRAVGSISANIAEGYSRGTGNDRARFYEYALGSTRETRDWYFKSRFVLSETVVEHRNEVILQIIRLLLTAIPNERRANRRL